MILPFQRPSYIERAVATLPGLVACWPLNDGVGSAVAKDYMGVNHGTISATGVTRGLAGPMGWDRQNGAMGFDGAAASAGMIDCGTCLVDPSGAVSGAFWMNCPNVAAATQQSIIDNTTSTSNRFNILIYSSFIEAYYYDGSVYAVTGALSNGTHHIAFTKSAGASVPALYIDAAVQSDVFKGGATRTTNKTTIGARSDRSLGYAGSLSCVALYNRALTAPEVQGLYLAGVHGV